MYIQALHTAGDMGFYREFCQKQKASVFNSMEWLSLYGEHLRLYGIFNDNRELTGTFYLFHKQKTIFNLDICPPFSANNGLVFENRAENPSSIYTYTKRVLEAIAEFLQKLDNHVLVFVLPAGFVDTQPFTWKGMTVKVKYTYHIDLAQTEAQLLANLSSEKRKSLNRAVKDELDVRAVTDSALLEQIILKTFERKQLSKNRDYLHKILHTFSNPENTIAYVAYRNEQALAATFCVHDGHTAYYLFGGYDAAMRHHGAGVSCMWKSILKARELGLQVFDFEGSMLPEVEKYFREFGGTLVPYYEISKARFPLSMMV